MCCAFNFAPLSFIPEKISFDVTILDSNPVLFLKLPKYLSSMILIFTLITALFHFSLAKYTRPEEVTYLTKCNPYICRDLDFESPGLKSFFGKVPVDFIKSESWFDSTRTRKCFQKKNVLFLGDSSTLETVEELNFVLNGTVKFLGNIIDGHVQHRNQIIHSPGIQSTVRFRWFGHRIVEKDFGGVASMMDNRVKHELLCLLGISKSSIAYCQKPDIVIVQSSHHDARNESSFMTSLPLLMDLLASVNNNGTKVYWKGSPTFNGKQPIIDRLNDFAAKQAASHNISFIDMTQEMRKVEGFANLSRYFATYPHIGTNGHADDMLLSNLLTQRLLREICDNNKKVTRRSTRVTV